MKAGFKLSDHVWLFQTFQDYLTRNGKAGSHYVESILDPYIKKVANFVFQSARPKLVRRKGSFHIFGLDFMIDDRFRVHFIEANGYPGYTWSINFNTRGMVTQQFDLIQEIHEAPSTFAKMRAGDQAREFQLLFSEVEEQELGLEYDPCYEFHNNAKTFESLRTAMRHFVAYNGYALSSREFARRESEVDCSGSRKRCKAAKRAAKARAAEALKSANRKFESFRDRIEGANWIGGLRGDALEAMVASARAYKCSFNKMGLMPATYRIYIRKECERAFTYKTPSKWLAKPLDRNSNQRNKLSYIAHQDMLGDLFGSIEGCKDDLSISDPRAKGSSAGVDDAKRFIVQRMMRHRQIDGVGWDFRAYMLIASTDPLFAFYHAGYARSSRFDEVSKDHVVDERVLSFAEFQRLINHRKVAGSEFVTSVLETYIKRVMLFVFRAAKLRIQPSPKTYQIFEFTFMLDESNSMWFLGANNVPVYNMKLRIREEIQSQVRPLCHGDRRLPIGVY